MDIEEILYTFEDDYNPSSMVPGPRNMYNQGQLVQPNVDGSRPGYSGDAVKLPDSPDAGTKSLGNGVYQITSKKGFVSYFGKYRRDGKDFKKNFNPSNFDGSLEKAKKAAANFVKEGADVLPGKSVIELQTEKGTLLEQPKYKTQLEKALSEVDKLSDKGYGNVKGIVDKYVAKFVPIPGTKNVQGKVYKTNPKGETAQMKGIRFAINEHAKKLQIQNIYNADAVKALDAYTKIKNTKRGDISRILKRFKVPEGTFNRYLQKLNLRNKIIPKFNSETAKKKFFAKLRNDAIKEYSSPKFENFLSAPETALVQKSHMGDLYNQYVRTGNLGYAPNLINQEVLQDFDTELKQINQKLAKLYKNKPKGYLKEMDKLNTRGMDLSAASQGYKKFEGTDPYTGKKFVINYSSPSQELDPTDLLGDKKLSDLKVSDKPTLEMLKEDAIKNAKLSKKETNKMSKSILSELEELGCGKSAGGRIMFGKGTTCAIKGREVIEEGLKNGFPKNQQGDLARKILSSGKFLKDAVSLRGLFGPAALAFTVAAETGIVGYDMLSGGKSFREAVGDSVFNYMLGDKTKIDSEEEFIKRLKNVPGSPGQGFRGFTDDDINKMLVFKSKLDDMQTGFSNYSDLLDINEKIKENTERQNIGSGFFPDEAFQLEAEKDKIQADIRDYNKVGTPRNVTEYMISDEGVKGGDALARGTLLAKESQLLDAYRSSPKGIENLKKDLIDTRFNLEQIYNPTKYNKNAKYFMGLPKSEQSKLMSYENMLDPFREKFMSKPKSEQSRIMSYGYKEGGIASLNVKK